MRYLFLDASAVVKRYVAETGSTWITTMLDAGVQILLAEITLVEVASAFARRARTPNGLTVLERDQLLADFLDHCAAEYFLVTVDRGCIDRAIVLTQEHGLRGYDAVQLATALSVAATLFDTTRQTGTFVAADNDLLAAARAEGLDTENPNDYT